MTNLKEPSNELRSWLRRGLVAGHAGDRAEARRCFQAARDLDADNIVALLWLAWLAPTRRESLALFCRVQVTSRLKTATSLSPVTGMPS
ncbi:MAG: hypothetical protein P8186_27235, partial [Anaerolineae bacterium]